MKCEKCRTKSDEYKTEAEAIAAWNRRADVADTNSGNKPLTLDELKQMDGEPVWTVTNGVEGSGRWEILESVDNEFMRLCNPVDTTYDCPIDTYGKTWLAYRTKPERSEG